MLITDKFVYIHLPKTGGSFVVAALRKLHGGAHIKFTNYLLLKRALYLPVSFQSEVGKLTFAAYKHSGCRRIPGAHRHKPILSNARHPLDYYVSQYEFGWWKRSMYLPLYKKRVPGFKRRFTNFPDLSFPEFLELWTPAQNHSAHTDFYDPDQVGYYTDLFVKSFFRSPNAVLERLDDAYLFSAAYRQDMFPVDFIHTHQLNRGLYDYLLKEGYPKEKLQFILDMERVLPGGKGRSAAQKWEKYYTPELKALMIRKDRLLFELFPDYKDQL